MASDEVLIITCKGQKPVEIRPGGHLNLGRHNTNDVVLADGMISRFHATMFWRAGDRAPCIRDNNSTNGVLIAGSKITQQGRISAGDLIEIGPFKIDVAAKETTPRGGQKNPYALPQSEGSLDTTEAVRNLLLNLERNTWTGTLELELDSGPHLVCFCFGRVISAYGGPLRGLAAMHRICSAETAAYKFTTRIDSTQEMLEISVKNYLSQFGEDTETTRPR
ncbi:FHA domain-containing protein [Planctomycetota bacterium]|nr:FHA domain-containing protein [Planctomycetota bacterium]